MNLRKMADDAARKYGVPPGLFRRLIQQESGWNPAARNPSGATGLVQIHLPSHPDITEAQASDPAFALGWGARYLAAQKARFGRWDLALAAYNAGPGNVENGKWQSFPETRNYVKNILGGKTAVNAVGAAPPPLGAAAPALSSLPQATQSRNANLLSSVFDANNQILGLNAPVGILPKPPEPVAVPLPAVSAPLSAPLPAAAPHVEQNVKGFVPAFENALNRLLRDTGLTVVSGYRSPERQAELFAAAVKKYGSEAAARKWVAPPGRSKHNHGVAADLGGNLSVLSDAMLRKYGLYRPMAYEPWHVELIGSRG